MDNIADNLSSTSAQGWLHGMAISITQNGKKCNAMQENAKVKGKGGVVRLTENPSALHRWIVAGPQMARLLTEFESMFLLEDDSELNYRHYEEGLSTQEASRKQASKLTDVITDYGNPFHDDYPELLVLHTRDCVDDSVVATIRNFETLGKDQYKKFKEEVLEKRERSIHDPIKRNSLTLFRTPKQKKDSVKVKQLAELKNDVSLFGRLYTANQLRDGDPEVFSSLENQLYLPSLYAHGKLRFGKKSDLLKCFKVSPKNESGVNSQETKPIFIVSISVHKQLKSLLQFGSVFQSCLFSFPDRGACHFLPLDSQLIWHQFQTFCRIFPCSSNCDESH